MRNKINFKILFRRFKHSLRNIGSDADKDWKIMISLFFVAFLAVVIFHINLFLNIQNRLDDKTDEILSINQTVNSEVLDEMIGRYDKRAEEYKKIEETQFQLIDPAQ